MRIGKVSENILKRSVLRQIRINNIENEGIVNGAGIGEDCAVFSFPEDVMAVSCMQEAVLSVSHKNLQRDSETACSATVSAARAAEQRSIAQLIQKCANNLAAKGAEPVAVLITLLLPESLEEADLKQLAAEARKACEALHMQIAGGQTRITSAVAAPCGVVTGIGKRTAEAGRWMKGAAPGQDVVVSKWIGLEGTSILARYHRDKLSGRYPSWLIEEAAGFDRYLSVIPEAATAMKSGVCAMHDASEGGIFGALWELAESAGVGLTIDLRKLPLRQETVEVCECCNVNPYELLSGGCLLMTSEDGAGLVSALKEEGIPAVVVGKIMDSRDRIFINEDEIRYMDRPKNDEIYGGFREL